MALTVTFSVGTPCAAGNHVPITVTAGAKVKTFHTSREEVRMAPEDGDVDRMLMTLLQLLVRQLANQSAANIKAKLEAITIDLSLS